AQRSRPGDFRPRRVGHRTRGGARPGTAPGFGFGGAARRDRVAARGPQTAWTGAVDELPGKHVAGYLEAPEPPRFRAPAPGTFPRPAIRGSAPRQDAFP